MKKTISIAIATLLLVCVALTGLSRAGAVKLNLYPWEGQQPPQGFVIINWPDAENSKIKVTLRVQVRNLTPGAEYEVWSGGKELGAFCTNAKGNGHFKTQDPPSPALAEEKHVNIWTKGKKTRVLSTYPHDPIPPH